MNLILKLFAPMIFVDSQWRWSVEISKVQATVVGLFYHDDGLVYDILGGQDLLASILVVLDHDESSEHLLCLEEYLKFQLDQEDLLY